MTWQREIDIWFAEQVFVHRADHRRYARRLTGAADDAEELLQEAYARLFALDDWRRIANPHAFTMRIIRNLAIEQVRRAGIVRIDQGAALQALEYADEAPTPDVVAAHRSDLDHVVAAMQKLPPRMREALHLRRIEGLAPVQVAERMKISVSTVETHLVKALRLLVRQLDWREDRDQAETRIQCPEKEQRETI